MTCCQIIAKKTADKYGTKGGDVEKVIPNLGNKTNHVVDYIEICSCTCP